MLSSWRLWLPSQSCPFPMIPMFGWLCEVPLVVDYALLVAMLACSFVGVWRWRAESGQRILWATLLLLCIAMVCLNQHRLQAWFYHGLLFSLTFLIADPRSQLRWLQAIVISIYAYSALGKFDYQFLHTVGQDFLNLVMSWFGLSTSQWAVQDRMLAASLMPISELLIAGLLCWHRSRRAAGSLACLFHVALAMLMLVELGHSWGVVLWNLQFAVQSILLFVMPSRLVQPGHVKKIDTLNLSLAAHALLLVAILMPVFERTGWWDHWPSWALYSPHSSRAEILIAAHAKNDLPETLQPLLIYDDSVQTIYVPLSQWSLQTLGVPIYPQARFQLGVALFLRNQAGKLQAMQVELRSAADRFTGERLTKRLSRSDDLATATRLFWINTRHREMR